MNQSDPMSRWACALVACSLVVVAGLLTLGCYRPASDVTVPMDPTGSTGARVDEAESDLLCRRVVADRTFEAARATQGDVMVLKYARRFREHEAVAAEARKLGASSARPVLVGSMAIFGAAGMTRRIGHGLTEAGMKRMASFVVDGRLPGAGVVDEVAMSKQDARDLGVAVGDLVTLSLESPVVDLLRLSPPPPTLFEATVVGLLDVGGPLGGTRASVWMAVAGVRAMHAELDVSDATGVAIHLERGADEAAFVKALKEALNVGLYEVLTFRQLQKEGLKWRGELLSVCRQARPPPSNPKAPRASLLDCDNHAGALVGVTTLTHTIYGQASLARMPTTKLDLPTWVPAGIVSRKEAAIVYQGVLFNDADAVSTGVFGSTSLSSLAPYVVRGDIAKSGAKGGVVVRREVAERLGIDVGHTIHLAVRPPKHQQESEPPSLQTNLVEVAALVTFPHAGMNDHLSGVFIHLDYAAMLHSGMGAGKANALSLWAAPGKVDTLAEDLNFAAPKEGMWFPSTQFALDGTDRSIELVQAYCKTRGSRAK